jgi:hypothetical protein
MLEPTDRPKSNKMEWTSAHVPLSISVCSNIPDHDGPICFVSKGDPNGHRCELNRDKTVNSVNGKLLSDARRQTDERNRYLLNRGHQLKVMRRNRDAFALVADAANYKIKIKEMALYLRKVQLSPAVRMGHVKALEKTSCKYPIRRVEVKVDTVPTT